MAPSEVSIESEAAKQSRAIAAAMPRLHRKRSTVPPRPATTCHGAASSSWMPSYHLIPRRLRRLPTELAAIEPLRSSQTPTKRTASAT